MTDQWLFSEYDLNNSISRRRGMDRKAEDACRRKGVGIIMKMGGENGLKLKPNPTLATAAVYFHRFYMFHPFQEYQKEVTALTCIFLAGKVEETPKKCRDVCTTAATRFPEIYKGKWTEQQLMEEVMGVERVLLQVLRFDLIIEHPYKYIQPYLAAEKVPQEAVLRDYLQKAWTFTNDSYYTPLCLLWEPQIVAVAMIHLSFTMASRVQEEGGFVPPEEWWSKYVSNMDLKLLEDVCHLVLDFYAVTQEQPTQQAPQQPKPVQNHSQQPQHPPYQHPQEPRGPPPHQSYQQHRGGAPPHHSYQQPPGGGHHSGNYSHHR